MHLPLQRGTDVRRFAVALLLSAIVAQADQRETMSATASEALALCDAADTAAPSDRQAILARGLERAEEALQANSQDAAAHFAVFCNLGKRTALRRGALGLFGILSDVARVRREIDDTLALAPDYPGALAAKGQMLMELPPFLGGDREEGQRLLHRAVVLERNDHRMRSMLARSPEASSDEGCVECGALR